MFQEHSYHTTSVSAGRRLPCKRRGHDLSDMQIRGWLNLRCRSNGRQGNNRSFIMPASVNPGIQDAPLASRCQFLHARPCPRDFHPLFIIRDLSFFVCFSLVTQLFQIRMSGLSEDGRQNCGYNCPICSPDTMHLDTVHASSASFFSRLQ